ncbi:MAG: SPFH domain-containing protein [Bifidobacteriaceae bacterium]|jgi:regulator of protease activity HflC (stomatin/prohibitin superfamily)|nr:SPFH domain-containing protein [Bifidobacteriaceae bacterium]
MSTIQRYPWLRHFLGTSTDYVVHLKRGKLTHQGIGAAFWFRPGTSAISVVPTADQELPAMFHATTADHQDVTIGLNVTFRFADPVLASQRLEFGVFPPAEYSGGDSGRTQAGTIITQIAESRSIDHIATIPLAEALRGGIAQLRELLTEALRNDERLADTGLAVLGLHVLSIDPEPEVGRALQTPLREQIQTEADRATYERRALAVERERTISENELASQIELATRREALVAQQGANARREAEEEAAAALVQAQGAAERQRLKTDSEASRIRLLGEAAAAREASALAVYQGVDQGLLAALALREAAGALGSVKTLTLTPDILSAALASLSTLSGAADASDSLEASAMGTAKS